MGGGHSVERVEVRDYAKEKEMQENYERMIREQREKQEREAAEWARRDRENRERQERERIERQNELERIRKDNEERRAREEERRRQDEERRRIEEERRRKDEEERLRVKAELLEQQKKLEEEIRRSREESEKKMREETERRQREEEERRRLEQELKKKAEEEARRNEEEKRQAEENKRKMDEALRKHEEERRKMEEEKRKMEAKLAEEAKRAEEVKRKHEEERKRLEEEEKQRQCEEAERKVKEEEERKRHEEELRIAEEKANEERESRERADQERERVEKELEESMMNLKLGIQPELWPTDEEIQSVKDKLNYRDDRFHFAVSGQAGSGKSSLINAFRAIKNNTPGSAGTGATETTQEIGRYPDGDPQPPRSWTVWFDIPGAGTLDIPGWQYFNQQGLFIFDVVIVAVDVRLTQIDLSILENCNRFKIPCLIVRSKADQHIRNVMKDSGYDSDDDEQDHRAMRSQAREKYITETRRNFASVLEKSGLPPKRVYIVSNTTLCTIVEDYKKTPKATIDEIELYNDLLHAAYMRRYSPAFKIWEKYAEYRKSARALGESGDIKWNGGD